LVAALDCTSSQDLVPLPSRPVPILSKGLFDLHDSQTHEYKNVGLKRHVQLDPTGLGTYMNFLQGVLESNCYMRFGWM
jgi:hypothetical protein